MEFNFRGNSAVLEEAPTPREAVHPDFLRRGSVVSFVTRTGSAYRLAVTDNDGLFVYGALTRHGRGDDSEHVEVRLFRRWELRLGTRPTFQTNHGGERRYIVPTEVAQLEASGLDLRREDEAERQLRIGRLP